MTQPIQLTDLVYAVEAQEGATGFFFDGGLSIGFYLEGELRFSHLPSPGNWQLICTTKEATDGNAIGIVKSHYSRSASYNPILGHYQTSGSSTTFMDYINGHCTFDNPLDSLRSLLTSKNLDSNKNYILIKKLP